MKAVGYTRYGSPDVLQIMEVEKPSPNDDQILVQVKAVSVNPAEDHMRKGILLARPGTGLFKPKLTILAADFAGTVEVVGKNVTQYKPGDEVFGRRGSDGFAEYVCVSEKPIMHKPANITFEQAAAVPVAALTALQSLRDAGQVKEGQAVLINGAAGGLGTFSVQIAKAFGAHVTGVCSTRNLDLAQSLGAERVIDYTRQDFTREDQCYDLIIDNVGNRSIADLQRTLKPQGICVVTGFSSFGLLFQHLVMGRVVSRFGSKKIGMMTARITKEDLLALKEMIVAGKVVPFVDKVYPLNQVSDAYRYLETKHARGKIVVVMS